MNALLRSAADTMIEADKLLEKLSALDPVLHPGLNARAPQA